MALSSGEMSLEMVSDMLGHEDPSFTKTVYAKYLPGSKRDAAERVSAYLRAAVSKAEAEVGSTG